MLLVLFVSLTLGLEAEPAPRPDPEVRAARTATTSATSEVTPVVPDVWDRLAECESGGDWSIDTGNGFYGGLQFTVKSWRWAGGSGMPHHASRAEQIRVAERLLDLQGWGAWPACSRKLGLR